MEQACARGWRVTALCQPPSDRVTAAGRELRDRIPAAARVVSWPFSTLDVSGRLTPTLDGGFINVASMVRVARVTLGDAKPDLVLATGPAFAEFIGAMALAQRWRVPYALDYRDEWSECPFEFVLKGNADRYWEARVLARASLVTFTTEAQRRHQIGLFPTLAPERTDVIPNGWDEELQPAGDAGAPGQGATVRIAFLGNAIIYDAPAFLVTLARALALRPDLAARIRVSFVGMKGPADVKAIGEFPVPGVVEAVDQVPLSEAQRLMRSADALLYLNPVPFNRYVGGKAWEYMSSGRTVLVYGEGGESAKLFATWAPARLVPRDDPAALAAALERIAARESSPPADPALLAEMARSHRAAQHLDRLEGLMRAPTGIEGASPPPL